MPENRVLKSGSAAEESGRFSITASGIHSIQGVGVVGHSGFAALFVQIHREYTGLFAIRNERVTLKSSDTSDAVFQFLDHLPGALSPVEPLPVTIENQGEERWTLESAPIRAHVYAESYEGLLLELAELVAVDVATYFSTAAESLSDDAKHAKAAYRYYFGVS